MCCCGTISARCITSHADYGPDEHRLIKRCQVMADRIFELDSCGRRSISAGASRAPNHLKSR